ncbi:MAG: hypothetical protein RMJ56_03260 [Gemmataceae bacterium]|nr:hypothetical protein [Gemmata sp.]MDW8196607.1 hypothetical protein [Gemmataceae bacterium]
MNDAQLERMARRASTSPNFFGWQLQLFAHVRAFDDQALADYLGCSLKTLHQLRICGAIRPDHFREDILTLATRFGLNPHHLAEAAKPLSAVPQPPASAAEAGVFLAARDPGEPP